MQDFDAYKNLPQIPFGEIKYLWVEGWYDGLLSGFCSWGSKNYFFNIVDQIDNADTSRTWFRRFGLYPITDHQWKEACRAHELFKKYVGTHFELENPGPVNTNEEDRRRYYEDPTIQDLQEELDHLEHAIGWFED